LKIKVITKYSSINQKIMKFNSLLWLTHEMWHNFGKKITSNLSVAILLLLSSLRSNNLNLNLYSQSGSYFDITLDKTATYVEHYNEVAMVQKERQKYINITKNSHSKLLLA
jgi:hypothetical protein